MTSELQALLAVQDDDGRIRGMRRELDGLAPRERELDRELERHRAAVARERRELEEEEGKRSALAARVAEHRRLHERNVQQLDQVRRLRDATAAQQQVETARRVLAEEEAELTNLDRRIAALREAIAARETQLAELEESQRPRREELAAERAAIQERIADAERERGDRARGVPRDLLSRYDRISGRARGNAVFALRGLSCGACDTAIPLQRRNAMLAGAIDLCEACGMLLYAAPEPAASESAVAEQASAG